MTKLNWWTENEIFAVRTNQDNKPTISDIPWPKIRKVGQVTNWSRKYVFLWPFRVLGHGLYTKKKLLQYLDIVGVVFSLSGFVQLLGDPPGILLAELLRWYLKLYIFNFKHIPWIIPLICYVLLRQFAHGAYWVQK